jgi:hypothetical protein
MFQEWLFFALKLLVVACVVALVVALLLMRAGCARIVAQSGGFEPLLSTARPARNGNRLLQRGA